MRALTELREWPALRVIPADGGGAALAAGPRPIVHLHGSDAAEVYLTWPAIWRLGAALAGSQQVRFARGADWVRVGLWSGSDVELLASLVSVAIQAHSLDNSRLRHRGATCPWLSRARAALVPA